MLNLLRNPTEHRLRTLWRIILMSIVLLIGTSFFTMVFLFLYRLFYSAPIDGQQSISIPLMPSVTLGSVTATILSIVIASILLDRRSIKEYGFHITRRGWWADLGFGLFLGAFLMLLIFSVEWLTGLITIKGVFKTDNNNLGFAREAVQSLFIFIGVGIYEEMIFRGYLLKNLAEGFFHPRWGYRGATLGAYLLSSIAFGVLHAANPNATLLSTINIIAAGIFLGLGFVLTGDLSLPIGLHITWNLFQGTVFGFPVSGSTPGVSVFYIHQNGPEWLSGGSFGPEGGLIGVVAILLGILLIIGWVRVIHQRLQLQESLAIYKKSFQKP